jgi:hypothetical protein
MVESTAAVQTNGLGFSFHATRNSLMAAISLHGRGSVVVLGVSGGLSEHSGMNAGVPCNYRIPAVGDLRQGLPSS